jgi:hypothetical protein
MLNEDFGFILKQILKEKMKVQYVYTTIRLA